MRLFTFITMTMAAFLLATTATAIEVSFVGGNSATIAPGETLTLNIALDNVSASIVQGTDVSLTGLSAAGATVLGGRAINQVNPTTGAQNPVHFTPFCSPVECFGGLASIDNPNYDPNNLAGGNYVAGADSVFVIRAVSFSPANGTGVNDPGLAELFGQGLGAGATDATLDITAQTVGVFTLVLGGEFSDGTDVLPLGTSSFELTVIPEPGTALLMGLGLAGLAGAGRGRRN